MTAHVVPDDPVQPQTRRILLLEDDAELAQTVQEVLETEGFEVQRVPNGVEGLKALLANEFDVILCDMVMPGLPGDMFYLAVRRVRPHFCDRFIFTTGHQGDPRIENFIQSVRALMVWKPFLIRELLDTIWQVLGKVQPNAVEPALVA